jgi:hypothetical protein
LAKINPHTIPINSGSANRLACIAQEHGQLVGVKRCIQHVKRLGTRQSQQ